MNFDEALKAYLDHTNKTESVRVATTQWWRKFTDF
jgi:hypothetical protein